MEWKLTCTLGPNSLMSVDVDFANVGPIFFEVWPTHDVGDESDLGQLDAEHHFDLVLGQHQRLLLPDRRQIVERDFDCRLLDARPF